MKPGDRVKDRVQIDDDTTDAGAIVVLEVRDDVSTDVALAGGRSLQAVAGDWHKQGDFDVPSDYDSSEDSVVWGVFEENLDMEFGSRWFSWDAETIRRKAASPSNAVTVYTYHAERLVKEEEP